MSPLLTWLNASQGNAQASDIKEILSDTKNEAKMAELFNKYDADKSGALDKAEFALFLKDLVPVLKGVKISEKMQELQGSKVADQIFAKVDISEDGRITLFEFQEYIKWDVGFIYSSYVSVDETNA